MGSRLQINAFRLFCKGDGQQTKFHCNDNRKTSVINPFVVFSLLLIQSSQCGAVAATESIAHGRVSTVLLNFLARLRPAGIAEVTSRERAMKAASC